MKPSKRTRLCILCVLYWIIYSGRQSTWRSLWVRENTYILRTTKQQREIIKTLAITYSGRQLICFIPTTESRLTHGHNPCINHCRAKYTLHIWYKLNRKKNKYIYIQQKEGHLHRSTCVYIIIVPPGAGPGRAGRDALFLRVAGTISSGRCRYSRRYSMPSAVRYQ